METTIAGREVRTFDITHLQTRDLGDDDPIKVSGYAAVFNSLTTIEDWFTELISPGAFARTLSDNGDIRALYNHNWDNVLGRTKSGTLALEEDDRGLKFEVTLPNTTVARDLAESMARGDVNQCSFGFLVTKETWDYDVEPAQRTIEEVELYEISVVSIPAYEDTEANLVRGRDIGREVEQRLKLLKMIKGALDNG